MLVHKADGGFLTAKPMDTMSNVHHWIAAFVKRGGLFVKRGEVWGKMRPYTVRRVEPYVPGRGFRAAGSARDRRKRMKRKSLCLVLMVALAVLSITVMSCKQETSAKSLVTTDFEWASTPYYGQTVTNFKSTLRVYGYWSDGSATNETYSTVSVKKSGGAVLADTDVFEASTEYEVTVETDVSGKGLAKKKTFTTSAIPDTTVASVDFAWTVFPYAGQTVAQVKDQMHTTVQMSDGSYKEESQFDGYEVTVSDSTGELADDAKLDLDTDYTAIADVTLSGTSYKAEKDFHTYALSVSSIDINLKSVPEAGETVGHFLDNRIALIAELSDGSTTSDFTSSSIAVYEEGAETDPLADEDLIKAGTGYLVAAGVTAVSDGKSYSAERRLTTADATQRSVTTLDVNLKSPAEVGESASHLTGNKVEVAARYSDGGLATVTTDGATTVKLYKAGSEYTGNIEAAMTYTVKVEYAYNGKTYGASKNFTTTNEYITSLEVGFNTIPQAGDTVADVKGRLTVLAHYNTGKATVLTAGDFDITLKDSEGDLDATSTLKQLTGYSMKVEEKATSVAATKTFTTSAYSSLLHVESEYVTTPYPLETIAQFKESLRIYGTLASGTVVGPYRHDDPMVKGIKVYEADGTTEVSDKLRESSEYRYEVSFAYETDKPVESKGSFSTAKMRTPLKITFSGRNTVGGNRATTSFITNHDFCWYDDENKYGQYGAYRSETDGRNFTKPTEAKYDTFHGSYYEDGGSDPAKYDVELYVNITFDDGTTITQMPVYDKNLPGTIVFSTRKDSSSAWIPLQEGKEFDYLVEAGILSGTYALKADFTYDEAKGQANARALEDYAQPVGSLTEVFDGEQFAFSSYHPVVFMDHKDIVSCTDIDHKRTFDAALATPLTIQNAAITKNVFASSDIGDDTKIGDPTDPDNFFQIQSTVGGQAIVEATPKYAERNPIFGYIWLRSSFSTDYKGVLNNKDATNIVFPTRGAEQSPSAFVFKDWVEPNYKAHEPDKGVRTSKTYTVAVKDSGSTDYTLATNNVLMLMYQIGAGYKLNTSTGCIPVPVGFKFLYDSDGSGAIASDPEATITSKYEMGQNYYATNACSWESVFAQVNGHANRKYTYYGYADKTKAIVVDNVPGKVSCKNNATWFNDLDTYKENLLKGEYRRYVETAEIPADDGYGITFGTASSDEYRLVQMTYDDPLYADTTPTIVYDYRIYKGDAAASTPMYISIENPDTIKKHIAGTDTRTVATYFTSLADNFKVRSADGNDTALSPTLTLYKADGTTAVAGTAVFNTTDCPHGHYLVVASYAVTTAQTVRASFAITVDNRITDVTAGTGVDRDVDYTKFVYYQEDNTGTHDYRLPTQKEWMYAMSIQSAYYEVAPYNQESYILPNYAFPYVFTHRKPDGAGMDFGFVLDDTTTAGEWFTDDTSGSVSTDGATKPTVKLWYCEYGERGNVDSRSATAADTSMKFRLVREY